ncbi:MAG: hypothetical protein ACYTAS_24540 [Planctomycetota bacterium]|jgi:hypothetical protein
MRLSDNRSNLDPAVRCLLLSAVVLWTTGPGRVEANSEAEGPAGSDSAAVSGRTSVSRPDARSGRLPTYYPSIDSDQAQEHREDVEDQRVWGRALPFFAQEVIDMGFDLPRPYGVSVIYGYIRQDLIVENLRVALNIDAPPTDPVEPRPSVSFSNAWARNETVQGKVDAWLFPFMNVFAVGGYVDGKSELDVTVDLDQEFPEAGGGLGTVTGTAKPKYHGTNVGIGTNLAAGWENYFAVISLVYVYTDLSIVDSTIETFSVSPRIGFSHGVGEWGTIAVYTGATYLNADVELTGQYTIPLPPVLWLPAGGRTLVVDYKIDEGNADRWNYLVGGNWDINRSLSLQAEVGFGESRDNVITSMAYRF